jgi:hypothetical protein
VHEAQKVHQKIDQKPLSSGCGKQSQHGYAIMSLALVFTVVSTIIVGHLAKNSQSLSAHMKSELNIGSKQFVFEMLVNALNNREYVVASAERSQALKTCLQTNVCPPTATFFELVDPNSPAIRLSTNDPDVWAYNSRGGFASGATPGVIQARTTFRRASPTEVRLDVTVRMRTTGTSPRQDGLDYSTDEATHPPGSAGGQAQFYTHLRGQSIRLALPDYFSSDTILNSSPSPKCHPVRSGGVVTAPRVPKGYNKFFGWVCGDFEISQSTTCPRGTALKQVGANGAGTCGAL